MLNKDKVREICDAIKERIAEKGIEEYFPGKPLFMVSEQYIGVWMEHMFDSIMYARLNPERTDIPKNQIEVFMDHQTEEGQLPCFIRDPRKKQHDNISVGYSQIQEVVAFGTLCLEVYDMVKDDDFLKRAYDVCVKKDAWTRKYRMTTGRGLIEMFVGFDTGHDNSGRLEGMQYPEFYHNGDPLVRVNEAKYRETNDGISPILAVDMNCNFYANLKALEKMADMLGKPEEAKDWAAKAADVKKKMFELLYNEEDCFFYDVDKNGNQRKYLSSTILHLFLERVLDKDEDKDVIEKILKRHILNPEEFWTPYPFPSMAINDPSVEGHPTYNCWGYYVQATIPLRCTRWMDHYGLSKELDKVCESWMKAWTDCYDTVKLAQEIDPITGIPTTSSPWYSSCMVLYWYSAKRLGYLD